MARKRPSALDALGDVAPPKPIEKPKKDISKYNKPATYRLPEGVINQLKHISQTERVKISELVTFALQNFVHNYETGKVILPKSEPAYYTLDLL